MKAAKFTVEGTAYYLVLDGEAMFQIRDTFGGTKLLLEQLEQAPARGSTRLAPPPRSWRSGASSFAAG